jgi:hypothetical protein
MSLKELIKEKRPSLSPSSITTYNSILTNLHKKVFEGKEIDAKDFDDTDKVLAFLKEYPVNKRKTTLSALVIITDNKKYREQMLDDIKEYNNQINTQEKSETQKDNWVNGNEIKLLWNDLKKTADLLYKKSHLTPSDLQQIQNFIIISLLGGVFISPRRSKDFCNFKIKNIDKETDNYLEKSTMIFNSYKTAKCYGEQKVVIPIQLKNLLNKWIKINPTDWLLFDSNSNSLSAVKLNQRLNKLFDNRKISVNALRHTFLSEKYANTIKMNNDLAEDMKDMGSSMNMAKTYIKKD